MSAMARADPYGNHRFLVEVDGLVVGGFSEVRGLSARVRERSDDVSSYDRAGTWLDSFGLGSLAERLNQRGRRSSATSSASRETTSPNLELRRGVTDDTTLWDWFRDWIDGDADPRTVRVFLLDDTGAEVRGWECTSATPVRWSGPDLVATRADVATVTLELSYDEIGAVDLGR